LLSLLGLVACGDDRPGASATPTPTPTLDAGLIQAALDRSLESTLAITATVHTGPVDITVSGAVDAAADTISVSVTGPTAAEVIGIGGTLYVQADGPNGEPWMQVDLDRLRPESQLRGGLDVRGQAGIVGGIVTVEQVGPGTYEGVADLNQAAAAADESQRAALTTAASMAENASSVPYEATIDDQGRLTRLFYTIETLAGPTETELVLSDFGEPVQVEAPPADQVWAATDDLYAVL
jgi:hypothetical protein